GARPGAQQGLEHAERLVIGMAAPPRCLAVVVVSGGDAAAARRRGIVELRKRFSREEKGRLVDAEELLVAFALAGSLRPGELVHLLISEGTRHRSDRLLSQEVGPDGHRRARSQVRNRTR